MSRSLLRASNGAPALLVACVACGVALLALCYAFARSRGTDTDLFPRWYGLQQLFLHGRDPYAADVTLEIAAQTSFLRQHVAGVTPPTATETAYGFLYPLPGALLLLPLALLPYQWALALWTFGALLTLPAIALLSLRAFGHDFGHNPSANRVAASAIVLALLFPTSLWNLVLAQPTLLVVLVLTLALWLRRTRPFVAGALLAGATLLKPPLLTLVTPLWLLLHLHHSWPLRQFLPLRQRREPGSRAFLGGFGLATLVLLGLAFLLDPRWLWGFLAATTAYAQVGAMSPTTPATYVLTGWLLPDPAARLGAVTLTVALLVWCLDGWRRVGRSEPQRLWHALVITPLVVPPAWETGTLLLLIPLAARLGESTGRKRVWFMAGCLTISLMSLPFSLVRPWQAGAFTSVSVLVLLALASPWPAPTPAARRSRTSLRSRRGDRLPTDALPPTPDDPAGSTHH